MQVQSHISDLLALLVADHHYTCGGESPELFALIIVVAGSKSTPGNVLISSLQKCLKKRIGSSQRNWPAVHHR